VTLAQQTGLPKLFWAAFKRSRNPMMLLDEERRCIDVNGAWIGMHGYPRARIVGQHLSGFLVPGPLYDQAAWQAALKRGEFTGEATMINQDGSRTQVQYAAHTEAVTGGQLVLGVVLSSHRWGRHFRRDPEPRRGGDLTRREREIVRLIADGASGPEIATELNIAHDTVRTHARNAMGKLGARSRAHLVAKALAEGHALSAEGSERSGGTP
jgi:PAS domain S-box-containing protein